MKYLFLTVLMLFSSMGYAQSLPCDGVQVSGVQPSLDCAVGSVQVDDYAWWNTYPLPISVNRDGVFGGGWVYMGKSDFVGPGLKYASFGGNFAFFSNLMITLSNNRDANESGYVAYLVDSSATRLIFKSPFRHKNLPNRVMGFTSMRWYIKR